MNTIKNCFAVILRGDKEESRLATRMVRTLLYRSASFDKDKYQDLKNVIQHAPDEFAMIAEDWRQEHFVMAVSVIYYLHDKETHPDFLFFWLFFLYQS